MQSRGCVEVGGFPGHPVDPQAGSPRGAHTGARGRPADDGGATGGGGGSSVAAVVVAPPSVVVTPPSVAPAIGGPPSAASDVHVADGPRGETGVDARGATPASGSLGPESATSRRDSCGVPRQAARRRNTNPAKCCPRIDASRRQVWTAGRRGPLGAPARPAAGESTSSSPERAQAARSSKARSEARRGSTTARGDPRALLRAEQAAGVRRQLL